MGFERPSLPIIVCQTLLRWFEALGFDGSQDQLFGHDEAVALVEQIIGAQVGWRQVDGDQVGAGAEAAAVTAARSRATATPAARLVA